jgi:RNA polymerase primary sigma factor
MAPAIDQHRTPEQEAEFQELRQALPAILRRLTYREREIIKLRYGLEDGQTYTLEEVGHIFKVTRERIRQVEKKAIAKLVKILNAHSP